MPYDERLAARIRAILAGRTDVTEKKMFGGIAFMVRGNMACGPHRDNLIVRIGHTAAAEAMRQPHVKPMDFTGTVMKNFATIEPPALRTDAQLRYWVELAAAHAESLAQTHSKTKFPKRTLRKQSKNSPRK
jgi:TfoX/Sxy family transcriptional regulator of competence genes